MPEIVNDSEKNEKKAGKAGNDNLLSLIREILSGVMISEKIILRNLGYIIFVTFLLALYIANRFHAERITRDTARLSREVKDFRAESLATSADLMFVSRQSQVNKLVKEKGLSLEELKTPPYKLLVSKK